MAKSPARILLVSSDQNGRRLDNFLTSALDNPPKSFVYRIIRRGEVRVNGGRARPDRKLVTADRIRIPPLLESPSEELLIGREVLEKISQAIVFEDDSMLVLNKPAGFAVHAGSGLRYGVIDAVRRLRPDNPDIELVHRIDRDTSGCLLIAKNYPSLRALQRQLGSPETQKCYLALLGGRLSSATTKVELKLATIQRNGEKRTVVDEAGKTAFTEFRVLRYVAGMSYVEARITTGRTHQIRVHAAAIGHPVAGDKKYADQDFIAETKNLGLNRMFLHAKSLTLAQTQGTAPQTICAPLPTQLNQFLSDDQ
jgi:23S rRNA pseudouridine955/2504/2580 synthase